MTGTEPSIPGFDGRVALVTGAASGIGRASALAFARAGARVVVADIEDDGGEETVALIEELGGTACFVAADVSSAPDVESMVEYAVKTYGRLDCAHNNAGMMSSGIPLDEYEEDLWDMIMDVNLKGTWLCMKYEIRQMRAQQSGSIVNTSSISGLHGMWNSSVYSASKHGILGLTRSAARDYAREGIRVNAVCPAWIQTPPMDTLLALVPSLGEDYVGTSPTGRLGTPDEVANAVVWLCSDAATYVTGHSLVVDGGMTA